MMATMLDFAITLLVLLFFISIGTYLELKEEQTMERREDDELAELRRLYGGGPVAESDARDITELEKLYATE